MGSHPHLSSHLYGGPLPKQDTNYAIWKGANQSNYLMLKGFPLTSGKRHESATGSARKPHEGMKAEIFVPLNISVFYNYVHFRICFAKYTSVL